MIYAGEKTLRACYIGERSVRSIYKGSTLVWSADGVEDTVTLTVILRGSPELAGFLVTDKDEEWDEWGEETPSNVIETAGAHTFTFARGSNIKIKAYTEGNDGLWGWKYEISENDFTLFKNKTVYIDCACAVYLSYVISDVHDNEYDVVLLEDSNGNTYTFYGEYDDSIETSEITEEGGYFTYVPYGEEVEFIHYSDCAGNELASGNDLKFTVTENVGLEIELKHIAETVEYVCFDADFAFGTITVYVEYYYHEDGWENVLVASCTVEDKKEVYYIVQLGEKIDTTCGGVCAVLVYIDGEEYWVSDYEIEDDTIYLGNLGGIINENQT